MFRSRFASVLVIAIWVLTPDVVCLLPGVDLTMDEHECCKRMAGECDMVPMPELHKCCQTVTAENAVISAKATDYPALRLATVPFMTAGSGFMPEAELASRWLEFPNTSPPPIIPRESIDVLRI